MSAAMQERPRQRRREPGETQAQSRFLDACHAGADASCMDELLATVRAEHHIRRLAREISESDIHPDSVHLIADLLAAATRSAVRV